MPYKCDLCGEILPGPGELVRHLDLDHIRHDRPDRTTREEERDRQRDAAEQKVRLKGHKRRRKRSRGW